MVIPASTPDDTPGSVEWRVGGGVNTVEGPGVMKGCLATWREEITTAWEPWYLSGVLAAKARQGVQRRERKEDKPEDALVDCI